MSILFRKIANYAVQKIASDPVARQQATDAVRKVSKEVRTIAASDDSAYETGRSVRRVLNRFKND
ncbi:hypothetical protein MTBPR1_100199 [Candidatus Terasakiella magnetica]|uniref:Uncharacterized protein n=1 Tax=Candidatus Terasakiella magnetica TaxID=1867952 RepID=A0A1C3REA2_9PROT|nr:hypothetical protein [Candidatus Terasakiella magnetica]SCA55558.1 hypothetical protein MTBPR1_100199 [Candidatus Terasakiella magnetica]